MPSKPKTPCYEPNCPKLSHKRYCEDHQVQKSRLRQKTEKGQKLYGNQKWRKLSKKMRQRYPFCAICLESGIMTPSTEVDHIVELEDGGSMYDTDNLQCLCRSCHEIKTRRERSKRVYL